MEFAFWMVLGASLVWGGIAWLKPSPQEMVQMKAREHAMKLGVQVKILPCGDFAQERFERTTLPFYSIEAARPNFGLWLSGEQWVAEHNDVASNQLTPGLESWLAQAPAHVIGVKARGKRIGAWWTRETIDSVDALKSWLEQCPAEVSHD